MIHIDTLMEFQSVQSMGTLTSLGRSYRSTRNRLYPSYIRKCGTRGLLLWSEAPSGAPRLKAAPNLAPIYLSGY